MARLESILRERLPIVYLKQMFPSKTKKNIALQALSYYLGHGLFAYVVYLNRRIPEEAVSVRGVPKGCRAPMPGFSIYMFIYPVTVWHRSN